ncbi:uncharacterized protein K02A2.6-like [Aedes albopictus]|uniref:RNA-directed DNA polymerase n=1 Tax=Aedes albopictus TaxID=7160 RepID=A0ABM2A1P1_AEDAL|nr:uncharacterized protein K02A2.6-like [Aedes albopictus]
MALAAASFRHFDAEEEEWELYKEQLEQYFVSNSIQEATKKAVLINHLSSKTYKLLRDLCTPTQPKDKTYVELCTLLSTHFTPPVIVHKERRIFSRAQRNQDGPETVNEWIARIKNLAANCRFGNYLPQALVNKFVDGLDGKAFDRICEEDDTLTLEKAQEIALKYEIDNTVALGHHYVKGSSNDTPRGKVKTDRQRGTARKDDYRCFVCNKTGHMKRECKFKDYTCRGCGVKGHLQAACDVQRTHYVRDTSAQATITQENGGDRVELQQNYLSKSEIDFCNVGSLHGIEKPIVLEVEVGRDRYSMELDSGAAISVVSRDMYEKKLSAWKLRKTSVRLMGYSGQPLDVHGQVKIELEGDANPVFKKPRQVPFKFQEQVIRELDKMEAEGIITKCDSSQWGTPLVPVIKSDGTVRLCGDYKVTVNKNVKDVKHPLPSAEEIFSKLNGGQKFSKLDLSRCYNQFELDEESKGLCAISTMKGVFLMNRLPFGIKPASGIVQRELEKLLCGIPGVQNFLDDVMVTGSSDEEHLERLRKVFEVLQNAGFKLNKAKCEFFKSEVTFLGYVVDKDGLRKTDERIPTIAASRMQRWAHFLSGFSYSIEHVGSQQNIADFASRFPTESWTLWKEGDSYLNFINQPDCELVDQGVLVKEISNDEQLGVVLQVLKGELPLSALRDNPYRRFVDELSLESGTVMRGHRVVVPLILRKKILEQLHKSHLGIVKSKSVARSSVWWPELDRDLEEFIKDCPACLIQSHSPAKAKLIPWEPPVRVWSRLHIDFAGPVKGMSYLIIVDALSKWVEVFPTKCCTSEFVLDKLVECISRFGLFDELVSDNGTQFVASNVQAFLKANGIRHRLTSPGHPATNGEAENMVKTFKNSLLKCLKDTQKSVRSIVANFLIGYRKSIHCTTRMSPSQMMLGRDLKTSLDLMQSRAAESSKQEGVAKGNILRKQQVQIRCYRGTRDVRFKVGDPVIVRDYTDPNKASWTSAVIVEVEGPRNYYVRLSKSGRIIKRHLNQIKSDTRRATQQDDPQALPAAVKRDYGPVKRSNTAWPHREDRVRAHQEFESVPEIAEPSPSAIAVEAEMGNPSEQSLSGGNMVIPNTGEVERELDPEEGEDLGLEPNQVEGNRESIEVPVNSESNCSY